MRLAAYDDVRRAAGRRLPRAVFEFVDGGAGGEVTLRANRAAFERVRFDPRFLVDVAERETATTVLGERVAFPVLLAPAGLARLVHPEGELAVARAAGEAGTIFCVSTASSCSLEQIADVATGPLWFQLYLWRSAQVVDGLVDRARAAGYHALVLTIDVPVVGNRERDTRNGVSLRPRIDRRAVLDGARRPRWSYRWFRGPAVTFANLVDVVPGGVAEIAAFVDRELGAASATWDDLDRLRRRWDGPLVVKGILSVEDAQEAVRRGADAVYVSNHGGRQLDGSPATLDVLPRVAEAVGGEVEVLLDGGVRRGEDAVKARALGARAVLVGRPWFHALAAGGEEVVARQLDLLRADVDRTLALVGVGRLDDVGRGSRILHDLAPNDRSFDNPADR
jgi:isopentenyl diphosphate isomerase/L-lactate dehydrogenase-like FMN-dependent dehydrogenase